MREWLVIENSFKNAVFATEEMQSQKAYIPRDVAEGLLKRDLSGMVWFTREEGQLMRAHPEWTRAIP